MPVYHTTLFDGWPVAAAALSPNALLFQVIRGGDAVHIASFTNMRGAGQLPSTESFEVHKISLLMDGTIPIADMDVFLAAALVEMRIKERTVFSAPGRHLLGSFRYSGGILAAAAIDAITMSNNGFALDLPITIPGGVNFVVEGTQQPVAIAAPILMKVVLDGYLTTPD
jgi:hypothetical protein